MAPLRYACRDSTAVQAMPLTGDANLGPFYGEPHKFDSSFRGPVHRRRCTDFLCCLIFIIAILSYVAIGIVAWFHGDPRKVLHPTNSFGEVCGQKGTSNEKRPILFYFNILKCVNPSILINLQCPTVQICVSQCPDKLAAYTEMQMDHKLGNSSWRYYRQFCKHGFNNPGKPISQVLRDGDCPSVIVPSRPFLQRCLPDVITLNGTATVANNTNFKDALETAHVTLLQDAAKEIRGRVDTRELGLKIVEDYALSWPWIIVGLLVSWVFSVIFIVLLRFTAALILWIAVIAVMLLLAYGICYCSVVLTTLGHSQGCDLSIMEVGLQRDLNIYLQLRETWIILLASLGGTEVSILLIIVIMRKKIRLAIDLLREASKAIGHIMSTLLYPMVTFFLLAICLSYSAVTALYLASSGDTIYKVMSPDLSCPYFNSTCNPETFNRSNISKETSCLGSQCLFAFYGGETPYHCYKFLLQISNLLIFLWLVNFILALQQCTLAGTFSCYYWAKRKPEDLSPCPILSSFKRAIRYHTGSLAFGALILSAVQILQIILKYLEKKLKGIDNSLSRFILCCLTCCFWCLEKCIRYMNQNAYIMVAIYGKNLCKSGQQAFFLLMRNTVRVAIVDRLIDFLLFFGKVMISGGVGVLALLFFSGKIPLLQEQVPFLSYCAVPIMTILVGAYFIAHGFFSVYATCVDTFVLCFWREAYSTCYSQTVSHPSTDQGHIHLASEI
ncbi:choline transporter-like protein 5-A isoform X2 [Syngnathoides biaculeatus]|uniref:choline transporter-like protein 5-A isoform X2 n=1 Tax=Syngnathoides biaculeatus TaxID=300417 RepID=UPI002ADDA520|nr:choline transporter-like protein 5-A isoform X2 [Syngnathoides biaculeatus]